MKQIISEIFTCVCYLNKIRFSSPGKCEIYEFYTNNSIVHTNFLRLLYLLKLEESRLLQIVAVGISLKIEVIFVNSDLQVQYAILYARCQI